MKRISLFGILFLLATIFSTLRAEGYKVEEIPMVHLQDRTRYVSNPDGILSEAAVAVMDTTLFFFGSENRHPDRGRSRTANRRR